MIWFIGWKFCFCLKGKYQICEVEILVKYYFNHEVFFGGLFFLTICILFVESPALFIFGAIGKFFRRLRAPKVFDYWVAIDILE